VDARISAARRSRRSVLEIQPKVVSWAVPGECSVEAYERLKELVESVADDVAKAYGGNKAAGTRVRKVMQEIKEAAQVVRKTVLEVRSQTPT
jgi:hypothetical protein